MIRTLLLILLTFALVPAAHAAERVSTPPVFAQAQPPARSLPQIQIEMQPPRNSVYETMAVVAIAGGAGALLAVLGTSALTTALVAGGAVGIVYLAASAGSEPLR